MFKSVLAAAAAVALVTTSAIAQDKPKIGLIQIDLSNPFHLGEVEGAKEAARRANFDLVVTSGEGDVTKQIQAMENLINEGVDAISINFIDAAAFGPTMAKAKAANIPVICLHSKIEGCAAMLGFDERYTGKIVGEYAAELLKAALQWRGQGRGRQPAGPARPGPQYRSLRRLHRRHGAISRRQGGRAGADQLGSDQGGLDHRELDDRLSRTST